MAPNAKKNLVSSTAAPGMEYLSLQMIALPALDTVLANMGNCGKCNDDYLHMECSNSTEEATQTPPFRGKI